MVRRAFLVCIAALLALAVVRPPPLRAQASPAGELAVFAANVLLGGVTAGVSARLHGASFLDGLGDGALGGAAVYAGKRLSTAHVPGAGLAGRVVGCVGASVIRNAAIARPPLHRIIVPVGPVSFYATRGEHGVAVSPKLNLGRGIYLGYLVVHDAHEIDWARSLSAGAPVFRTPRLPSYAAEGREAGGLELLGAISAADTVLSHDAHRRFVLAHERVHLVQDDVITISWTDPIEDWLLGRVPGGEVVRRYVDTDLPYLGFMLLGVAALPYESRPWEIEAGYLDGS